LQILIADHWATGGKPKNDYYSSYWIKLPINILWQWSRRLRVFNMHIQ